MVLRILQSTLSVNVERSANQVLIEHIILLPCLPACLLACIGVDGTEKASRCLW